MNLAMKGAISGLIVGVLDCALFTLSGQPFTKFDAGVAITFWTGIGFVIFTCLPNKNGVAKGIALALLLNIPWAVEFAGRGRVEVLLPMVVLASLFGAILGWLSKELTKKHWRTNE